MKKIATAELKMKTLAATLLACWLGSVGIVLAGSSDAGGVSIALPTSEQVTHLDSKKQPARLGELRVSGAFLDRVVLKGQNGATVVLDAKQNDLKVPADTYTLTEVRVKKGSAEAVADLRLNPRKIVVRENSVTNLIVGGPLTNAVSATRRGNFLRLGFRLVGADGLSYRLSREDRSKPPEFLVWRGDRKVASGKFEFG
jgi:hypothetical protein